MTRAILASLAVYYSVVPGLTGENWPQWRGPTLDGRSDATNLPASWSKTENVVWKTPLPSWAGSTPIIWGDRIFVTTPSKPGAGEFNIGRKLPRRMGREHPGGKKLLLLCLNKRDGAILWQRTLSEDNKLYGKQNMASPSPVTDGKHVWALTGTGVLTAFDLDGTQVWQHKLQQEYGEFGLNWGYGSSPLLYDGKVIVPVMHGSRTSNPSYLVAYDGVTGKKLWWHERKTDATRECPDAYTTPTLLRQNGRTLLVVSGANYVTAHDPATGQEVWRAGGLNPEKRGNFRICNSPLVVGDMIYAGSRNKPLLALRGGGTGDVTSTRLAWKFDGNTGPDVPTPVCDGKYLYMVNDRGIVTCLDARSGDLIWGPERTERGTVSASPLLAAGKLYITNEAGTTTVLRAGAAFEILASNALDDAYTISSIAVSGGRLFIRTSEFLYCIGGAGASGT